MTIEELKLARLQGQYLLERADSLTVTRNLCGVQAQFFGAALHALRLRTGSAETDGLVKSWTLRGTVHLFPEADLPLYRRHCGGPEDVPGSSWYRWRFSGENPDITPERDLYFARVLTESIREGCDTREGLRRRCRELGMTEGEERHVFNGWGGTFAELAEMGVICSRATEEKAFRLCPPFSPMEEHEARIELARRYFTHYGPATLRDAAYFFRVSQAQVKAWLRELPAVDFTLEGRTYFHIPREEPTQGADALPEMPGCVLLAGFDQLMLGYRKEDNPFLPPEHLRGIFNLTGIVLPAILLRGRVVGRWKHDHGKVTFTLFEKVGARDRKLIEKQAATWWAVKKIEWA